MDVDGKRLFEYVNYTILMPQVARNVNFKQALRLVRKYLQSGSMASGWPA